MLFVKVISNWNAKKKTLFIQQLKLLIFQSKGDELKREKAEWRRRKAINCKNKSTALYTVYKEPRVPASVTSRDPEVPAGDEQPPSELLSGLVLKLLNFVRFCHISLETWVAFC